MNMLFIIKIISYLKSILKIVVIKLIYFKQLDIVSVFSIFLGTRSIIKIAHKQSRVNIKNMKARRDVYINVNGGKLEIGYGVFFNNRCSINCQKHIKIGDNSIFGENVLIYDHDHKFNVDGKLVKNSGFISESIVIGNNVWIGANVTVLKGVAIGDNSVVASGTTVYKDIPENTLFYQEKVNKIKSIIIKTDEN